MKEKLSIDIECGMRTCAASPSKFCRFLGTVKFGQVSVCTLFPNSQAAANESVSHTPLKDENGWVMRCPDCLASANRLSCFGKIVT